MYNESPISFGSKVNAKVKFFLKQVKVGGQGHGIKNFGTDRKVLPQEYFFKRRSKATVKVTGSILLVPNERSCHKEYT